MMKRLLIAAFSTGWLFPMWVSVSVYFDWLTAEVWPRLRGEHPLNSFPFTECGSDTFTVGCAWLAAVIFFWAWRLSGPIK